jgi:NodT family efflux transporter outer membrane factor (OMF) lipoprotein
VRAQAAKARHEAPAWAQVTRVALPLLVWMTGCMVGPKYKVPVAATAPAFKEADPALYKETPDWHVAQPGDTIPRGDWWTLFHDAGLNALEPQVAAANQTLKIADANLRNARAFIKVQRSNLYPTIGTQPFVGGLRDSANQPYFNASNANNGDADLILPVDVNYEVDLWGAVHRSVNAAGEEAQATAADRETALLSLEAELAMDYFNLRAADAQQKLLNDTVAQYENAVRITNNRFLGGVAGKSDLTQAQTQLQDAKVAASDVAIARAQYEHAIAVLIGQPPAAFSLPPAPLPLTVTPPAVPAGLPSELLERRPDIAAAERRTAEANEQIGIARAAYFPSLNLSAAAGFQSVSIASLFNKSSFVYSLGPTLGETFFDGGRRRGLSEQAFAGYDRATATYRQTVLTAYQQVEDNLVALRVLAEEAAQQRQATASAQESERIFNNRYVGGVDTYLQVITAQTTALANERNDIDILRRRMEASVVLVKVLGGGWDRTQLPPR